MSEEIARYEALLEQARTDPAAEQALLDGFCAPGAALVVAFLGSARRLAARGPVYTLAAARSAERALRPALEAHGPLLLRRLRDGLLVVYPEPAAALLAALDAASALACAHGPPDDALGLGLGLGWGTLLLDPAGDASGLEINAAFVLAGGAGPGEALGTDAFVAALGSPPPGLGAHRGRADRIHQLGLPFTVLRDYRA